MTNETQALQMACKSGFIAALDRSGGSTPGALRAYGRSNPVSNNTDEAGKAANRRVELVKL